MKYFVLLFLTFPALSQEFFNVELRSNWNDTTIIPGSGNARFSDLWGFTLAGEKYAVIGSTEGSHFLKINDYSTTELDFKKGAFSSLLVQHRDYKQYGNYIYAVCDEGTSSLQIFDISHLPDSVSKVYDSSIHFTICHNIFIDSSKARLYACGPDNLGMKIFDLSDPTNPMLLLNFTNLNYVHDCFVRNDTAFLNAGVDGLRVYNFSNINAPQEIGVLTSYQEKGYNHSGWMNKEGSVYCFVDETEGKKIKYCKLNDGIENIQVDALFGTRNAVDFVAHNIYIVNGFAFVSYYNEGFRIFDLEQSPIKQVGFYDTYPLESSFKLHGAWGVFVFEDDEIVIVSDRQMGLFSFYFPFKSLRNSSQNTYIQGIPFVNATSKLIIAGNDIIDLKFDIYSISGKLLYRDEVVKNWINIPLKLNSGQFIFKLYSSDNKVLKSGSFVVLN